MGEWAFATDNCAHWLLGFNDQTGKRQANCAQVECPKAYYKCPEGAPASDCQVDPSIGVNGPFGTNPRNNNQTLIEKGLCYTDNTTMYSEDEYLSIADCVVSFIDDNFDASFMWTAHNEINMKWDYVQTYDAGWFRSLDKNNQKIFEQKKNTKRPRMRKSKRAA